MLRFISVVFYLFAFAACESVSQKKITNKTLCESNQLTRKCPELKGSVLLPRYYNAQAIYIGFSAEPLHLEFLNTLIKEIQEMEIKPILNILIPRLDEWSAYDILRPYFHESSYDFINLIPTSSNETVWVQDYFEIFYDPKLKRDVLMDLPYMGREGEDLPASISLACKKELIPQAEFKPENLPDNGDYGGNIEGITEKVLIVGNNISNETFQKIRNTSIQEIVEIDVAWLETGHVDELITTLPHKEHANACEQTLLVASPLLAYELLEKNPKEAEVFKTQFKPFFNNVETWPDKTHCLKPSNFSKKDCISLRAANIFYEQIITKSMIDLNLQIEKQHGCKLSVKKFPQIFVPFKMQAAYGTLFDRAVPMNPNSVNNIFFYPHLLLAKQEFGPFQHAIEQVLSQFPYQVIYVNGKFVHDLNGGIHCATNISYGCQETFGRGLR